MRSVLTNYYKFSSKLGSLSSLTLLVVRVMMGILFVTSGYGKLTHLDHVIEFFTNLNIPFPGVQAPFVATVEFVGGICLLGGLFTRLFSLLLMGVMVVALLTAKLAEIDSISTLIDTSEFLFLILLGVLATFGPGSLSLDSRLTNR